jgi:hypothetical protein
LIVESTETSRPIKPAASAHASSVDQTTIQMRSRCQRRNSPYTDGQCP